MSLNWKVAIKRGFVFFYNTYFAQDTLFITKIRARNCSKLAYTVLGFEAKFSRWTLILRKSPQNSLPFAQSLPHNSYRNQASDTARMHADRLSLKSCDREELMCEMRKTTVKKISHFRWLMNAEKYFTEVIESALDLKMISKKLKGNCSSYSKSINTVKTGIYLICSLHETALICLL